MATAFVSVSKTLMTQPQTQTQLQTPVPDMGVAAVPIPATDIVAPATFPATFPATSDVGATILDEGAPAPVPGPTMDVPAISSEGVAIPTVGASVIPTVGTYDDETLVIPDQKIMYSGLDESNEGDEGSNEGNNEGSNEGGNEIGRVTDKDGNEIIIRNDFVLKEYNPGLSFTLSGSAAQYYTSHFKGEPLHGAFKPKWRLGATLAWMFGHKDVEIYNKKLSTLVDILNKIVSQEEGYEPTIPIRFKDRMKAKKARQAAINKDQGGQGGHKSNKSNKGKNAIIDGIPTKIVMPEIGLRVRVDVVDGTVYEHDVLTTKGYSIYINDPKNPESTSMLEYVIGHGWQIRGLLHQHSVSFSK